jgi:hypothetical protein
MNGSSFLLGDKASLRDRATEIGQPKLDLLPIPTSAIPITVRSLVTNAEMRGPDFYVRLPCAVACNNKKTLIEDQPPPALIGPKLTFSATVDNTRAKGSNEHEQS